MEYKPVAMLIKEKEVTVFKDIIENLKDRQPEIRITPFKYGTIGDDRLVSFKVSENHYTLILESLVTNNLRILLKDPEAEKVVKSSQQVPLTKEMNGWQDIKKSDNNDNNNGAKSLELHIKEGNYNEVIRISRNINFGNNLVQKAKISIPVAVTNAIKKATIESDRNKSAVEGSIKQLIKIASDINLKSINLDNLLKQAGIAAIQICTSHPEECYKLIEIGNNSTLHNMINVKAAIAFAQLTLNNEANFEEDLALAVRNLNTRWLSIAHDIVSHELSKDETAYFNQLMNYIFEKRNT